MDALDAVPESDVQAGVLKVGRDAGWIGWFTRDSRRSPTAEPDVRLVHPEWHRFVLIECKTERGKLRKGFWGKKGLWNHGQDEARDALMACPGVEYYIAKPSNLDEIYAILMTKEAPSVDTN